VSFEATVAERLVAIGASALLHAGFAAAVVIAGHSSSGALGRSDAPTIEIAVLSVEPPAPPEAVPSGADMHPTHTHPYPVARSHATTPHDPLLVHAPLITPALASDEPAAAPQVIVAEEASQPRFRITVGRTAASPGGASASDGAVASFGGAADVLPEAVVDSGARFLSGNEPAYPPQAGASAVEADVPLEIVVDASGQVVTAHVVKHVGYGFDEAAVRSVRAYVFLPATSHGHATAVRMKWTMAFRLH
jgi:TonB family protein